MRVKSNITSFNKNVILSPFITNNINPIRNYSTSSYNNNAFKSIYKGIKRINDLPKLPNKLLNINNSLYVKIFRYIGTLCLILNVSRWYQNDFIINLFNNYPSWVFNYIIYFICFISILFIIYIVFIKLTK